jgi:hypothetical protein
MVGLMNKKFLFSSKTDPYLHIMVTYLNFMTWATPGNPS